MKKLARFIISGGSATAVNLGILFLLTHYAHFWYVASSMIAFLSAFIISFVLQKFWTFEDHSRDTMHLQAVVFFCTVLLGLALNTALVFWMVEYWRVYYLLAQIISGVAIAVMNFFAYKHFIFHKI